MVLCVTYYVTFGVTQREQSMNKYLTLGYFSDITNVLNITFICSVS